MNIKKISLVISLILFIVAIYVFNQIGFFAGLSVFFIGCAFLSYGSQK